MGLSSESDTDEPAAQHPQTNNSALAALLHGLSSAGAAGCANAWAAVGDAAAGGAGNGFASEIMQAQLAEVQQLVAVDVERLTQQWRRRELPKLQAGAHEIWQE